MFLLRKTSQFKKDYKKIIKQGVDIAIIDKIIVKICSGEVLEAIYRDHALIGNYYGARECHIKPDLLLIYEKEDSLITLRRLGSHSELFKK